MTPRIVCATCGARTAPGKCAVCEADPSDLSAMDCPECDGSGWIVTLERARSTDLSQSTYEKRCPYCVRGKIDRPYEDEYLASALQGTVDAGGIQGLRGEAR